VLLRYALIDRPNGKNISKKTHPGYVIIAIIAAAPSNEPG
jgi:hypothetical protein